MTVLKDWLIEALTPLANGRPTIQQDIIEIQKRNIPDEPLALLVIEGFILRTIFKEPTVLDDLNNHDLWLLARFCEDNTIVISAELDHEINSSQSPFFKGGSPSF